MPPSKRDIIPETIVIEEEDIVEVSPRMMEGLTTILPTKKVLITGGGGKMNNGNMKHKLHSHKYDMDLASNEFSTEMHTPEILVIILVLCLWVLSLRKLVKHFDKLRSTQYREIPYKYRLKDPENIANVKIANNQNESVIYLRDPVKSLRSKSIPCPNAVNNASTSDGSPGSAGFSFFGSRKGTSAQLEIGSTKKKSIVDAMLFGIHQNPTTSAKADRLKAPNEFPDNASYFSYKKNLSSSLNSMAIATSGAQRQCRNHSVGYLRTTLPPNNELGYRASVVCYNSSVDEDNPNGGPKIDDLDPAFLLPVVVRRSLLDLHRKSVDNLAAAAAACVPSTDAMSIKIPSPSKKKSSIETAEKTKTKRFNLSNLRPPKLNLHRKSNNVKSDSSHSVKMTESPV